MPCAAHRLACVLHAVGRDVECLEAESQSALSLWSCVCRAAGGADSRHNTQTRKKKTGTSLKRTNRSFESSRRKRSTGSSGEAFNVDSKGVRTPRTRQTDPSEKHQEESARGEEGGGVGDERRVKLWNAPQWAIMNFIRDSSSGRNKKDGFM